MKIAITALVILILLALVGGAVAVADWNRNDRYQRAVALTGGDPHKGKQLVSFYGCGSCHTIRGIRGAEGLVGPPLNGIANRVYVGGVILNTPDNLMRWVKDPPAIDPKTAMPNMHVTDSDARDIASFLYTLRS